MSDFSFVVEALLLAGAGLAAIALVARIRPSTPQPANSVVAHPPQPRRTQLERQTVAELQSMARRQGLSGISRLRKAELIDQLLSQTAGRG